MTSRSTEAMEASPSHLSRNESQIQYSKPFLSPSSESLRALSLTDCGDADGWMTRKMSWWKIKITLTEDEVGSI